ncbi:MAG: hypothetical protein JXR31_03880 [Prolixibacteraceae bacterium]|nr:hypothetical protein [Prolixibacteraceae bacterium]
MLGFGESFTIFLIIVFPICGLIGYYIKTKNHERLKLIENGINPDDGMNYTVYRRKANLRTAILLLSLGFGLIVAYILSINFHWIDKFIIYLSVLLIFGGFGFLINYFISKKGN